MVIIAAFQVISSAVVLGFGVFFFFFGVASVKYWIYGSEIVYNEEIDGMKMNFLERQNNFIWKTAQQRTRMVNRGLKFV